EYERLPARTRPGSSGVEAGSVNRKWRGVTDAGQALLIDADEEMAVRAEPDPGDGLVVSAQGEQFLAGGCVPQPDAAAPAAGDEQPIVGADREGAYLVGLGPERETLLPGWQVPHGHGGLLAGCGQPLTAGSDGHAAQVDRTDGVARLLFHEAGPFRGPRK